MKRTALALLTVMLIGLTACFPQASLPEEGTRRSRGEQAAEDNTNADILSAVTPPELPDGQTTAVETNIPVTEAVTEAPALVLADDEISIKGRTYSIYETELYLYYERLTPLDLVSIGYMVNLKLLDLDNNSIPDITALSRLINLEELHLDHNRISDLTPLSSLHNLEFLSLYNNRITDISPLAGLTNLESLTLWENRITDISPLAGLINLEFLDLDYNDVSDLTPLFNLKNLETLYISGNRNLTEEQVNELRDALPDCRIYSDFYDYDWDYDWGDYDYDNWDREHHQGDCC